MIASALSSEVTGGKAHNALTADMRIKAVRCFSQINR